MQTERGEMRFPRTVDEFQYFLFYGSPFSGHIRDRVPRGLADDRRLLQIVESKLKSTFRRLGFHQRKNPPWK